MCILLSAALLSTVALTVMDGSRPQMTRRYLQGSESERIALFLRDGKVTLGEVGYAHDWLSRPYTNEIAHGVWLVRGDADVPFDMAAAKIRTDPDGIPVQGQTWLEDGVETDFEACAPFGRRPTVQIRLRVTNRSTTDRPCRMGLLLRTAAEKDLIHGAPDLYCEYRPDVSEWTSLKTTWTSVRADVVCDGDRFLATAGDWTGSWDAEKGLLGFTAALRPGESRTVDLALGKGQVEPPSFEQTRQTCRAAWAAELVRVRNRHPLVRAMTTQMLQCFSRATDGTFLPRQGGLQRWVWPGETIAVVEALSRLGYHDYVEKTLAFFFDGGYPTASGEIGPFGNRWSVDTACIVRMFALHCSETGDATLWRRWREPAMKAYGWIRTTRASTRGRTDCVEGLFPPLKSTDMSDTFQNWGHTDLLNLDALERLADAAEKFKDPQAQDVRREAKDYRDRIAHLLDAWRKKSIGKKEFVIPFSPDGSVEETVRKRHFFFSHPGCFAACGFLNAADMLRVRAWLIREGVADGKGFYQRHLTLPQLGNDTWYTTWSEHRWFQAWRRVGREDLAKETLRALLARSVTAETLVGERVDDRHPWFFPWCPNASGAARIALMLLDECRGDRLDVTREAGKPDPSKSQPWPHKVNDLYSLEAEGVDALHLAYAGETTPTLVIRNLTSEGLPLKGRVRVVGFDDEDGFDLPVDCRLSAAEALRLPIGRELKKGVWTATAELESTHEYAEAETRFAVVKRRRVTPAAKPGEFRFGIVYHMERYTDADNEKCLDALVQAGVKLVRTGFGPNFFQAEPEPGRFDWSRADKYLPLLEQRGIAANVFVSGAPKWALGEKHAKMEWNWAMPARPGLFRDYCRAVASRYGTRIAWYEFGNELDLQSSDSIDANEAIAMQKEGYEGIKAGCPDAKVIPNGWAVVHSQVSPKRVQMNLQERVMTEAKGYYDAHPLHQHGPYREFRRRLREFFAWRKDRGIGDTPWYANETAATTAFFGEEKVACCVWQKMLCTWAHGSVDHVWYNLRARGDDPRDGEAGYGLVTGDFYPRVTYAAFAGLTSCFEGLRSSGIVHEGPHREMYRFAGIRDGVSTVAFSAWDDGTDKAVPVRVRTDAKRAFVADLFDNRKPLPIRDGFVEFPVGKVPSALVLEDVSLAEPSKDDLVSGEAPEIRTLTFDRTGKIEFRMYDYDENVYEVFKADPRHLDLTWHGCGDLSGTVHAICSGDRLRVYAWSTDDCVTEGDRLAVLVKGKRHAFPPHAKRENGAVYIGDVPLPGPDEPVEIRIEDDDGSVLESWVTTGRFYLRCRLEEEGRPES